MQPKKAIILDFASFKEKRASEQTRPASSQPQPYYIWYPVWFVVAQPYGAFPQN
jgi:hypothetical protein